jgi:hypothetical protein
MITQSEIPCHSFNLEKGRRCGAAKALVRMEWIYLSNSRLDVFCTGAEILVAGLVVQLLDSKPSFLMNIFFHPSATSGVWRIRSTISGSGL